MRWSIYKWMREWRVMQFSNYNIYMFEFDTWNEAITYVRQELAKAEQ